MSDFENYQADESPIGGSGKPFDDEYSGYDPRLASARFDDSFRMSPQYSEDHFGPADDSKDDGYDMVSDAPGPEFEQSNFDNGFNHGVGIDSPSPFNESFSSDRHEFRSGEFSPVSDLNGHGVSDLNGHGFHQPEEQEGFGFMDTPPQQQHGSGNGSILPPPEEMEPEEGFLLREWKRQNADLLAEKERVEKERLTSIMDEADAYKNEFFAKRKSHCESQKNNNRDKEQVFVAGQEHFHKTADKHYWKAVSELIPNEVPTIESKRANKEKERNKGSVIFNQGPKPGRATDMARMRQVLLKLKHNPPPHMKTAPPPPAAPPKAEGDKGKDDEKNKAEGPISNAPVVEVAA